MVKAHANQIKLYRFHMWLSGVTFLLAVLFVYWTWGDMTPSGKIGIPLTFSLPTILHLALAYGSKRGSEISRKISVGVGVLMLLTFPIGTVLAFSFLPLTQWKDKADELASTSS